MNKNPWIKHRDAVSSDDSGNPTTLINVNIAGGPVYVGDTDSVNVDIIISDSSTSWDVTPLFWNPEAEKFTAGDTETVSSSSEQNQRWSVATKETKYMYFKCDNSSGSGTITIYVQQARTTVATR